MEPQVQYVRSVDGTRIAFSTMGRGRPLVMARGLGFLSMEAIWQSPEWRNAVNRLAQGRTVVNFDQRGRGLSERDVNDFSLEATTSDLAAVIDRLGTPDVDLMGVGTSAPAAIAYAVLNPESVRRLVLHNPAVRGGDLRPTSLQRAMRPLIEDEWRTYVRTRVLDEFGWDVGKQVTEKAVEAITPEMFVASGRAFREYDVTDLLPRVRCPTLVVFSRGGRELRFESAKDVAAAIPNARLASTEAA